MRKLLILSFLVLASCAKQGAIQGDTSTPDAPTPQTPTAAPIQCAQIDTCTYSSGFIPRAIYNCVSATYELSEHPEIDASLFQGSTCLNTKQDFQVTTYSCGPMGLYRCTSSIQGPGAPAIP